MRRTREETAETRRAIVEAASRLFRARGIAAVSVADVMGAVDMTVGGFYRHFESKEALVAEAIEAASLASVAGHEGESAVAQIDAYLSAGHRDHADVGCPVAALCSEVAHESKSTKRAFTRALQRMVAHIGKTIPGESKEARARRLQVAASMVGALVLARASSDAGLSDELLEAVKGGLLATTR